MRRNPGQACGLLWIYSGPVLEYWYLWLGAFGQSSGGEGRDEIAEHPLCETYVRRFFLDASRRTDMAAHMGPRLIRNDSMALLDCSHQVTDDLST
jgi:hypothetical protein